VKDSEVLSAAAEIVMNGFAKDGYALNEAGLRVDIMSPDAKTFCMLGAVTRIKGDLREADIIVNRWVSPLLPKRITIIGGQSAYVLREAAPNVRQYPQSPRIWNDEPMRTKEQVAAVLREAAKSAANGGQ